MAEKIVKLKKTELFFRNGLMKWNEISNKREMPWKFEKDPYKIWISEIILQQTRVEQGLDYYNRFIKNYPTIKKLALAKENDVFKLWEGLGYYSRCRNLMSTAQNIVENYQGIFPDHYEDILKLKGVGPYTAAAIASFAYNLPFAVVDGNVIRVLSRFFGIDLPMDSSAGKNYFNSIAQIVLDKKNAAIYNQAIMDFGATVCKPKLALCQNCPLSQSCFSYNKNKVYSFPVKSKSILVKKRKFNYVIATIGDSIYINKRSQKDIWQNLHEFILIETSNHLPIDQIIENETFNTLFGRNVKIEKISNVYQHKLTHQNIEAIFIHIKLKGPILNDTYLLTKLNLVKKLAFPKLISNYMNVNASDFQVKK
jgi:A/G-specific adenine glycosylase